MEFSMSMPIAEMRFTSMRSPAKPPSASLLPKECVVELTVEGATYSDGTVAVKFDDHPFVQAAQPDFDRFCREITGQPARIWADVARGLTNPVTVTAPVQPFSTIEQNLLKACFLTYLWQAPLFIRRPFALTGSTLLDEFIIDYTGRPGRQPFIYYPPAQLQERSLPAEGRVTPHQRLYILRILCRLQMTAGGGQLNRVFMPLVVPGVPNRLISDHTPTGAKAMEIWRGILDASEAKLREFARRNP
ncbi:MAG TPA: hypothetical protein VG722_05570 [Tepidisphaeraceae bacterium]|nr:hypothetical protein [Tepidisphaeraceae bacterium]